MSEEEREALEQEFQIALDNIVSKIKGETATAIVCSEQPLILLFRKLMFKLEQEKEKNEKIEKQIQDGTLSDGCHSFNDLYYQRCVLFATICNLNKEKSWKSKRHNDGEKCFDSDDWFIVGIDTPQGSYTYHYEIKYWDLFDIQELEVGKPWDGHTDKDVTRLLSLGIDENIDERKESSSQNAVWRLWKNETIKNSQLKNTINFYQHKFEELNKRFDKVDKLLEILSNASWEVADNSKIHICECKKKSIFKKIFGGK